MKNYLCNYDPFFDMFYLNPSEKNHSMMRTDIIEKEDSYLLKVNIPGVKKEDVKISLNDEYLTVNVSYKEEKEEKEKYLYQERRVGEYSRSYNVGKYVKEEDISASINDGVLTITIKKVTPQEKKHQYIQIN